MAVTAALVKELREKTGSGMMDCKKALVESDCDMEKAILWLREKGLASASKRSERIASEGLVLININESGDSAAIIEINTETDFVAKNKDFRVFAEQCAKQAVSTDAKDVEQFLNEKWGLDDAEAVTDALTQKISVIGENIKIRRFEQIKKNAKGVLSSYVHGEGKIAVVVYLSCANECAELSEAAQNVAMQIAAMNPRFISQEEMSPEFIASEKEIFMSQAKQDPKMENKPLNVIEKIVEGKLQKEFKEFCLEDQEYVRGEGESVKEYLNNIAKVTGAPIKIEKFVKYAVGEGIEKKSENFADEVAKAMGTTD